MLLYDPPDVSDNLHCSTYSDINMFFQCLDPALAAVAPSIPSDSLNINIKARPIYQFYPLFQARGKKFS